MLSVFKYIWVFIIIFIIGWGSRAWFMFNLLLVYLRVDWNYWYTFRLLYLFE